MLGWFCSDDAASLLLLSARNRPHEQIFGPMARIVCMLGVFEILVRLIPTLQEKHGYESLLPVQCLRRVSSIVGPPQIT